MDFKGYVDKGWIKPTEPITLPDGTPVTFKRARPQAATNTPSRIEKSKAIRGWRARSLKELASEQGVGPLKSLDQLAGDWPKNESVDEFLRSVRKGRK
ncbi:MAG: hypothetical protein AABZ53_10620 [Planctomycetota bacterium]